MSADLLREAAAKMRERAEAATPGPWECYSGTGQVAAAYGSPVDGVRILLAGNVRNAEHSASWHPAVALAVAEWLDEEARWLTVTKLQRRITSDHAVAVARAYLGDEGITR